MMDLEKEYIFGNVGNVSISGKILLSLDKK